MYYKKIDIETYDLVFGILHRSFDAVFPIVGLSLFTILINRFGLFDTAYKILWATGIVLLIEVLWMAYCTASFYADYEGVISYYVINISIYTVISFGAFITYYIWGEPVSTFMFLPYKFFYVLTKMYDFSYLGKYFPLSLFFQEGMIGKCRSACIVYLIFVAIILLIPLVVKKSVRIKT